MDTKICNVCNEEKPVEQFAWRTTTTTRGKYRTPRKTCYDCWYVTYYKPWQKQKHIKDRRQQRAEQKRYECRRYLWEFKKQNACVDCGEDNPIVLELDHRNREEKHRCVSQMMNGSYAFETFKKEVEKCDVRCANCHKKRTTEQLRWFADLIEEDEANDREAEKPRETCS